MPDYKNPDNIGNHLEFYGYEGWPDLQDNDNDWTPWEDPDRRDDE